MNFEQWMDSVDSEILSLNRRMRRRGPEWKTYTPGWDRINPGTGSREGAWVELPGGIVHFWASVTLGAGFYVDANPRIGTPTAVAAHIAVQAWATDTGSTYYPLHAMLDSTAAVLFAMGGVGGSVVAVTAIAPFTWAAGDMISVSGTYRRG